MTITHRFISKQLLQRSCAASKPAEQFDLIISRIVAHNLLRTDAYNLPFQIMRPPMFAVFNATDGFFASPDHLISEDADTFIRNFPKRFERQGYYKTGRGERINPNDVILEKQQVDDVPPEHWVAVTAADLDEEGELPDDWTTFELWLDHEWNLDHKHLLSPDKSNE